LQRQAGDYSTARLERVREIGGSRGERLTQQGLQPEANLASIAGDNHFTIAGDRAQHRRSGIAALA
jgi:hypothetical protein